MRLRDASAALRRAFSEPRLVAALWATNAAVAVVAVLPVALWAWRRFGHSLLGRGDPSFAPELVGEVARALLAESSAGAGLLLACGAMALAAPALAGGTTAWLARGGRFRLGDFLRDAVELYPRSVQVSLCAGAAFLPVVLVIGGAAGTLRRIEQAGLRVAPYDGRWIALLGLAAGLLVAWRAAVDVARARVVLDGSASAWRAALGAVRLVLLRPAALVGYGGIVVAGWAAGLGVALVHAAIPVARISGVAAAIVAAQIAVCVRVAFGVAASAYAVGLVQRAMAGVAGSAPADAQPDEAGREHEEPSEALRDG